MAMLLTDFFHIYLNYVLSHVLQDHEQRVYFIGSLDQLFFDLLKLSAWAMVAI